MAADEVMLSAAVGGRATVLRCYQWAPAAVSLGYFQDSREANNPRFARLDQVRRLSGGGAIIHDREVTYSIAVPPQDHRSATPSAIYALIHRAVIAVLGRYGMPVRMRGDALAEPEPFLCFGRGDPRDLVVDVASRRAEPDSGTAENTRASSGDQRPILPAGTYKVLGSAQRRRSGAVLQHGSLLLAASEFAPEFPGLCELLGFEDGQAARAELQLALADEISTTWTGQPAVQSEFDTGEIEKIKRLEQTRYMALDWK